MLTLHLFAVPIFLFARKLAHRQKLVRHKRRLRPQDTRVVMGLPAIQGNIDGLSDVTAADGTDSVSQIKARKREDPAAIASNGSHDGLVYVVQDPQHEVLGVFKNRSVSVELAIERARAEIEKWLDDRFQDEEDATCAEHLDVRGTQTLITWYKTDDEADDSDDSGKRQVSLHRWSVQMFSIQ